MALLQEIMAWAIPMKQMTLVPAGGQSRLSHLTSILLLIHPYFQLRTILWLLLLDPLLSVHLKIDQGGAIVIESTLTFLLVITTVPTRGISAQILKFGLRWSPRTS